MLSQPKQQKGQLFDIKRNGPHRAGLGVDVSRKVQAGCTEKADAKKQQEHSQNLC